MSQFDFLKSEFPALAQTAAKAEAAALSDPRNACFHARLTLEIALQWLYRTDPALRLPYQNNLAALIAEPSFAQLAGQAIVTKARLIKDKGNWAAHREKPPSPADAMTTVRELFHVCYWIARTYARTARPDPGLRFDPAKLEKTVTITASTVEQIKALSARHKAAEDKRKAAEEARKASEDGRAALEAELARVQAELVEARRANQAVPDPHDYDEAATRDEYIDHYLKEVGWPLDQTRDREFPVTGMPNQTGKGFVDYVLWGDDGKPLALVEAKRTKKDPMTGQQQAKLYADCLEAAYGQRPVIFCTNGYTHWMWDDAMYPPREVAGFLKKDELVLLHQRRGTRRKLSDVVIDNDIAGRFYQSRAIRHVGEAFERDRMRTALLVMATGSGKTRTTIALVDQLMRANWVRRVLFLADRRALVTQAHAAFKTHLPSAPAANLLDRHDPAKNDHTAARVCLSTYQSMMKFIDDMSDGSRRFGPGHFDLIVIDEAHRSVYRKYRAIFEYFDSLLLGLTATPRDEIDRDTYSLFHLERGVPTDSYDLPDAVADGFLVPPRGISVPLRYPREGIRYDALSDEEKADWDAIEWDDEGTQRDSVEAGEINKWLYNIDTIDKVLAHLMANGLKVDGGDRLGKTIIFARNSRHAALIAERFDANYPDKAGKFARLIDYSVNYAQSLIDDFSESEKEPHIAVSVDMLDTGIDVPEVLNLVFFKPVRSKTKFWQMIGRGTRLCPDIFGPGADKTEFLIFDYCENFEFFNENPDIRDAPIAAPIGQRLFRTRTDLIAALMEDDDDHADLSQALKTRLRQEVEGMNTENFLVRPKRREVERFRDDAAWERMNIEDRQILTDDLAGLPSAFRDDELPARQFDLLVLNGQLALLQGDARFTRFTQRIIEFAENLELIANTAAVKKELPLIQDIQSDTYWTDITVEILEDMRRRLRSLAQLIEPKTRNQVVTNFTDEIGTATEITLEAVGPGVDLGRFNMKARQFVEQHRDHIALQRLKRAEPLTAQDLRELERMLCAEAQVSTDDLQAQLGDQTLGMFLRSLAGLDRAAAQQAFSTVTGGGTLTAGQIEFINLIITHLVEEGRIDPARFFESPFTDIHVGGIAELFPEDSGMGIVSIIRALDQTAEAS